MIRDDEKIVQDLVDKIIELSPTEKIDILIDNAALAKAITTVDITLKDYEEILTVNLKAPFILLKIVDKHMMKSYTEDNSSRGKIINISSILRYNAFTHSTPYTIAKAVSHNLTKTLSNEWAAKGVNVNALATGPTDTESAQEIRKQRSDIKDDYILSRIPINRPHSMIIKE